MAEPVTVYQDNEVTTTTAFNQRVSETNAALAAANTRIDGIAGTGTVDGEIPALKLRATNLETRATAVEARASALETTTTNQGQAITAKGEEIAALKTENTNQGATLTRHGTDISALQTGFGAANAAIAAANTAIAGKAATATYTATLLAAGWVGAAAPYTQAINVAGIPAGIGGVVDLAQSTTLAQYEAAAGAMLLLTGQAAGSLTITAYADKPTVDLPLTILTVG